MIRCVVFDFDGTLVDSNDIKREAYYRAVEEFAGAAAILSELLAPGAAGDRYDVFRKFVERVGGDAALAKTLTRRYSERCEAMISACEEIRGATECLRRLRQRGKRLYVSSGTPQVHLRPLLERRGLDRLIDGSFGGPISKVENLRTVLEQERATPEETVVVGDGLDDAWAAETVGCGFIAVLSPGSRKPPALRQVPDLVDLADYLT
jgi:phosphoglycolate phosphatase-like HAD superfamily hydrolase